MKMHPPLRPLAAGVRKALFLSILLVPALAATNAVADSAARTYHIEQGDLGQALTRFAKQAGIVLSFDPAITRGQRTAGLNGEFGVDDGLRTLLSGSGLRVVRDSDERYFLTPAGSDTGALELGATSVVGSQLGATTEGTGSYTTGSTSTATKMNLSIKETPQSISVITRQQMDDQHLASVTDVLKQNPGITMSQDGGERFHIYSRGSEISTYQLDGVNTTQEYLTRNMPSTLLDMALFDRVEIVRGATGLMTGAGEPNGVVNLVRKRPTHEFKSYIQAGVGSWDYYRAEADVSGPLIDSGKLRGRLVAAKQTNNSFMDWYSQERDLLYGVLEADLGDATTVRFGIDYQTYDADGAPGVPLYFSNRVATDFSRSTSSGPRWMYEDITTKNYSLGVDHELGNGWQLKLAANYMDVDRDSLSAFYRTGSGVSYIDQATGTAVADLLQVDAHQVQRGMNLTLQGPFELLGQTHDFIAGFDYLDYENNHLTGIGGTAASFNFYTWENRLPEPASYSPLLDYDVFIRQTGYFLATRLNVTDDLHLILGARATSYRYDSTQVMLTTGINSPSAQHERGQVTPYAGVVYDLTPEQSVYASYTDIFKPQSVQDRTGQVLEPVIGENYEMGWKGEFLDGRLNTSAAIYLIKRDNLAEQDGDALVPNGTASAYRAVSGAETKGIDLELSGEVLPGWNLHTGYSHSRTEDANDTRLTPQLPLDTFRLWSTWRLPAEWDRLTVGGGVNWNSRQSVNFARYGTRVVQDDYAVASLMARYKLSEHLAATLNVDNLFDKKYYAGLAGNYGHYGTPRNATLNLRYDF